MILKDCKIFCKGLVKCDQLNNSDSLSIAEIFVSPKGYQTQQKSKNQATTLLLLSDFA